MEQTEQTTNDSKAQEQLNNAGENKEGGNTISLTEHSAVQTPQVLNGIVDINVQQAGTLSDGAKYCVYKGYGKHAMRATRECEGNQEKYEAALMAQLVTINNQPITIEDLENMPLPDYMEVYAAFAGANFITSAPKI